MHPQFRRAEILASVKPFPPPSHLALAVGQTSEFHPPDLRVPVHREAFVKRRDQIWPKGCYSAPRYFESFRTHAMQYTLGKSEIARSNIDVIGFFCPTPETICYDRARLRQELSRSASTLNATMNQAGWVSPPLAEQARLMAALAPEKKTARTWAIRIYRKPAGEGAPPPEPARPGDGGPPVLDRW
jgi:hypothetical protein